MLNKPSGNSRNNPLIIISILLLTCWGYVLAEQNENVRIIFNIKPKAQSKPVFDWLEKEDICWGIEVPWYSKEPDIRRLR